MRLFSDLLAQGVKTGVKANVIIDYAWAMIRPRKKGELDQTQLLCYAYRELPLAGVEYPKGFYECPLCGHRRVRNRWVSQPFAYLLDHLHTTHHVRLTRLIQWVKAQGF